MLSKRSREAAATNVRPKKPKLLDSDAQNTATHSHTSSLLDVAAIVEPDPDILFRPWPADELRAKSTRPYQKRKRGTAGRTDLAQDILDFRASARPSIAARKQFWPPVKSIRWADGLGANTASTTASSTQNPGESDSFVSVSDDRSTLGARPDGTATQDQPPRVQAQTSDESMKVEPNSQPLVSRTVRSRTALERGYSALQSTVSGVSTIGRVPAVQSATTAVLLKIDRQPGISGVQACRPATEHQHVPSTCGSLAAQVAVRVLQPISSRRLEPPTTTRSTTTPIVAVPKNGVSVVTFDTQAEFHRKLVVNLTGTERQTVLFMNTSSDQIENLIQIIERLDKKVSVVDSGSMNWPSGGSSLDEFESKHTQVLILNDCELGEVSLVLKNYNIVCRDILYWLDHLKSLDTSANHVTLFLQSRIPGYYRLRHQLVSYDSTVPTDFEFYRPLTDQERIQRGKDNGYWDKDAKENEALFIKMADTITRVVREGVAEMHTAKEGRKRIGKDVRIKERCHTDECPRSSGVIMRSDGVRFVQSNTHDYDSDSETYISKFTGRSVGEIRSGVRLCTAHYKPACLITNSFRARLRGACLPQVSPCNAFRTLGVAVRQCGHNHRRAEPKRKGLSSIRKKAKPIMQRPVADREGCVGVVDPCGNTGRDDVDRGSPAFAFASDVRDEDAAAAEFEQRPYSYSEHHFVSKMETMAVERDRIEARLKHAEGVMLGGELSEEGLGLVQAAVDQARILLTTKFKQLTDKIIEYKKTSELGKSEAIKQDVYSLRALVLIDADQVDAMPSIT